MPDRWRIIRGFYETHLMTLAVLLAVVFLGLVGAGLWQAGVASWRVATEGVLNVNTAVASRLANDFASLMISLERIGQKLTHPALLSLDPALQAEMLFNPLRLDRELLRVMALDSAGRVVLDSVPSRGRWGSFGVEDWFVEQAAHPDRPQIGRPFRGAMTQSLVLPVTVSRRRADGAFDGVILGAYRVEPLLALLGSYRLGEGGSIALARDDGLLLFRVPFEPERVGVDERGTERFRRVMASVGGTFVSPLPRDGRERLTAVGRVEGTALLVTTSMPVSAIEAELRLNALAVFVPSLMLSGLLLLLARRLQMELAARRLEVERARAAEAEEAVLRANAESELSVVLRDTVVRQEAERRRIAQELHDSVGQHMAVLHLGLDGLMHRPMSAGGTREALRGLKTTATAVNTEVSRLARELRPVGLDELGLENAIRSVLEQVAGPSGLHIDLECPAGLPRLEPAVEATVFRVTQEAVTNVLKHAQATRVEIVLEPDGAGLRVVVEDDGVGFDVERGPGQRLGLRGMRERLALVGGTLEIESGPGRGTSLFVRVPA